MDSWFTMVLMCGLLSLVSLQGTIGSRLPQSKHDKMRESISRLYEHYNTLGTEWVGRSVFGSYLNKMNSKESCSCQTVLLDAMLNVYEEIFKDMAKEEEVKTDLKDVTNMLQNLKEKYNEEQKVWRDIQEIHLIKVKNSTIQRGALNDFLTVYEEAYRKKHHNRMH